MLLTRNWGHAGGANAIWHYRFFGGPDAPLGMFDESHGMMVESASPSSFLVSDLRTISMQGLESGATRLDVS
jgi:hypothetical protein